MIKSQCTYLYRPVVRVSLINVNFEDLLSDDVERFTAVHSTEFVSGRCSTLCCCAIVLDINVLALPVEAHIVTNKPNQRESPLLLWENSLESVTQKQLSQRSLQGQYENTTRSTKNWGPTRILWSRGCIPNRWRGSLRRLIKTRMLSRSKSTSRRAAQSVASTSTTHARMRMFVRLIL